MKKLIAIALLVFLFTLGLAVSQVAAQGEAENYYRAKVVQILEEGETEVLGFKNPYQKLVIEFLSGPKTGEALELEHGRVYTIGENQMVAAGDLVVINATDNDGQTVYWIADKYRLQPIIWIAALFVVLVLFISRLKGLGSLLGMILSLLVIVRYIVPQILTGADPLLVSLAGGLFIMFTTMYLAHGYSRQTTIAIIATFLTLALTGFLAYFFVIAARLTGMGSEEAYSLSFGPTQIINLRGLLLGGIIIGVLGVLDDVTTTQAAAVYELAEVAKKSTFMTLFRRGMNIGREHVSSLVNTLIMAYAGAALPIFIFFVLNPTGQPAWVIINNEMIAEEVIRSLTGSFGLVLAVPLTTALSAWAVLKYGSGGKKSHSGHLHAHP